MFEEYREKNLEEIVGLAEARSRQVNNNYFDLGELLFYIKENDVYKYVDGGIYGDDKAGWRRFCDDKLDIGYRTAQYWVNIFAYFYSMAVPKEELNGLGWSKAKEMVDVTGNANHLKDIITFAKNNSLSDTRDYIAKYQAANYTVEEPLAKFETMRFRFRDFQATQMNDAISLAKETFNVADDSQALANIALDWIHIKANTDETAFN